MKTQAKRSAALSILCTLASVLLTHAQGPVSPTQLPADLTFDAAYLVSVSKPSVPKVDDITTVHYTLAGPTDNNRLIPGIRLIPYPDGKTYFGTANQEIFQIDPITLHKQNLTIPNGLPALSWPTGFTYDTKRDELLLSSLGGIGYLYSYSPKLNQWALISNLANLDLDSIAYNGSNDSIYAVQDNQGNPAQLHVLRLSPSGAVLDNITIGAFNLVVSPTSYKSELIALGRYVVLLVEPRGTPMERSESRLYLIDTSNNRFTLVRDSNTPGTNPEPPVITHAYNPIIVSCPVPVLSIEVFANGQSIAKGESSSGLTGFQTAWKSPGFGNLILTAVSRDFSGLTRTSAPVSIRINDESPPSASFQLTFAVIRTIPAPTNVFQRAYNSFQGLSTPGLLLPAMRAVQDPTDSGTLYGVWQHTSYQINRSTGVATAWGPPSTLPPLLVPSAVAADTKRARVLLASTDGVGHLYAYSPHDQTWTVLTSLNNRDLASLVYNAADDSLYALESNLPEGHFTIDHFKSDGLYLNSIVLPRLPSTGAVRSYRGELVATATGLVLILQETTPVGPGQGIHSFIYQIDPRTGTSTLTYVGFNTPPPNNQALQSSFNDPAGVTPDPPFTPAALTISAAGPALIQLHLAGDAQVQSTTDLTATDWSTVQQPAATSLLPATNAHEFFRIAP